MGCLIGAITFFNKAKVNKDVDIWHSTWISKYKDLPLLNPLVILKEYLNPILMTLELIYPMNLLKG